MVLGHYSSENKNKKCDIARMAEWSKAVDLSPTISGCAGSNPAPRIFFDFYCCADMAQWSSVQSYSHKLVFVF